MNNRGFTLIEIIIALAIFATIAVITSSVLYQSFQTRERVTNQADRLNDLQLTMTLLQRDTAQFVSRPVRGNEMHLFPPIVAQPSYVEFTRGGAINPMGTEQRSTLKRVAYICNRGQLIRRTWVQLDTPNREDFHDAVLLTHLDHCTFAYMGMHNNLVPMWYQDTSREQGMANALVPKAIQVSITPHGWGKMVLLFIIPKGLYVG